MAFPGRTGACRNSAREPAVRVVRRHVARAFERSFQLADYVKVNGASLENGLLHVDLVLNGLEMAVRYPDTLTRVYDQAFLKTLTEREAKTLAQLHTTRDAIFNLICDELGSSVGYGKTGFSEEQKSDVANEAKKLIQNLEQAEHSAAVLSMEENVKLAVQRLLKKHHGPRRSPPYQ